MDSLAPRSLSLFFFFFFFFFLVRFGSFLVGFVCLKFPNERSFRLVVLLTPSLYPGTDASA